MKDSISDIFTRIRNASLIGINIISVPNTKIHLKIIEILLRQGFIHNFDQSKKSIVLTLKYKNNKPLINQIQRLSRPGCRIYVHYNQIPQICGELGIIFISTSRGILTDREARKFCVGGELLGFIA